MMKHGLVARFKAYSYSILAAVTAFFVLLYLGGAALELLWQAGRALPYSILVIGCASLYVSVNLGRRIFDKYSRKSQEQSEVKNGNG